MGVLPTSELIMLSCVVGLFLVTHLPQNAAAQRQENLRQYPWHSDEDEGYVPPELSPPYQLVWWNKRVRRDGEEPIPDYPLETEDVDDVGQHLSSEGGIQKRDYTAAQLLNMLKQLAKNRKHRQIRIAGKSLRFGISRK